jgi:adenylylsulfate kinase-like enzyme
MIIWLTGQPGSGKTTLAKWLQASYPNKGVIVDGDDIREIFNNKDYSEEGRRKNIDLAQKIAKFLHLKGDVAIVSLVSPYKDQRDEFKSEMGKDLIEVYVHTTDIRGRENFHVENYQPPTEFFIDIDTTNRPEFETVQELRLKIKLYE